jgi:hypothetical protein
VLAFTRERGSARPLPHRPPLHFSAEPIAGGGFEVRQLPATHDQESALPGDHQHNLEDSSSPVTSGRPEVSRCMSRVADPTAKDGMDRITQPVRPWSFPSSGLYCFPLRELEREVSVKATVCRLSMSRATRYEAALVLIGAAGRLRHHSRRVVAAVEPEGATLQVMDASPSGSARPGDDERWAHGAGGAHWTGGGRGVLRADAPGIQRPRPESGLADGLETLPRRRRSPVDCLYVRGQKPG